MWWPCERNPSDVPDDTPRYAPIVPRNPRPVGRSRSRLANKRPPGSPGPPLAHHLVGDEPAGVARHERVVLADADPAGDLVDDPAADHRVAAVVRLERAQSLVHVRALIR